MSPRWISDDFQSEMPIDSKGISKASALRREIRRKLREVGIRGTLRLGAGKIFSEMRKLTSSKTQTVHPFDLKCGTDTDGIIEPGALDIPDDVVAHAVRYQTAKVEVFLDIINSLSISYEEFFFVDLGSGKGRALLLASQFPFKAIIGVELSPNLHRIACQNIQIYRDELQKCHRINSVCENVTSYKIPMEKIVFYLFNPFDKHVIRPLMSNIEESIRRYPREICIAYLKPVFQDVFDGAVFLETYKRTERYVIYKNKLPVPS